MVTAEAAYCALGSSNTRVHCLPTTLGIDYRIINGRVYIGGNAVTDPAEIARRTEEFQQRAFYYYENWERLYAQWREKMLALIARCAGAAEARAAGVRAAGARARRARHRLQPLPARDLPEDARGLLPDVAPPLRVPAARLRRLHDLLRLLQEGLPGDQRPDRGAHGGRHRRGDLPSRRGAAAPGALRGGARASTRSSRTGARRQAIMASLRSARRRRAARGSRSWRPRAIPGSTSTSATASITTTAPGTTTCRCRSRACPATSRACRRASRSSARSRSCRRERRQLIEDYRELLGTDEERARLRPDDHARASRVPVRRGAQVLLRALVHEPVLQQDPRIRRAARRSTASSPTPRTCSSSRTTSSSPRSST